MKRTLSYFFFGTCAFAGGIAGTAILQNPALINAQMGKNVPPPPPAAYSNSSANALGERFEQIISKISPSVVAIEAIKPPAPSSSGKSNKPVEESGSGVIVK